MLTIQQIKANTEEVISRLAVKGFDGREPVARAIALDDRRRQLQLENDNKAASLNKIAASIGALMKQGRRDEAEAAKSEVASIKEAQRIIAAELDETEAMLRELLATIPNLPSPM
ncbi:MAG: serine--tRNA ligase, partial [Muribaculaceae bacterium]|nr:serine--tRNA ligase [Muribaculaceae bacterium]